MKLQDISLVVLLLFNLTVQSQTSTSYAIYKEALQIINPAFAGVAGGKQAFAATSSQLTDLRAAEQKQYLSYITPLGGNMSGAITLTNNSHNITNNIELNADFSYNLQLVDDMFMSFGLKLGGVFFSKDLQSLNEKGSSDNVFSQNADNEIKPNIGAGMHIKMNDYFVSLAIPKLLNISYLSNNTNNKTIIEKPQVHFYTGYTFDLSSSTMPMKLTPSLMLSHAVGIETFFDLGANFELMNKFELGMAKRLDAGFNALIAFKFLEKFKIGYGYESVISEINLNSHQLVLRAHFSNSNEIKPEKAAKFY